MLKNIKLRVKFDTSLWLHYKLGGTCSWEVAGSLGHSTRFAIDQVIKVKP